MLGLRRSEQFLYRLHIFDTRFLPYGGQLIPLSAILSVLDKDWDTQSNFDKLAQWFWCGVFGELYGGTTETRFGRDLPEVLDWLNGGPEPRTVVDAVFTRDRLLSLRTRGSAAYKGIYTLLLGEEARDFRTGQPSEFSTYFDERIDVHHIFPQRWCQKNNVPPALCDSIINKTPLTARTNRVIGGYAPSEYVTRIQNSVGITAEQLDDHLRTHLIDPYLLRTDNFTTFFERRQTQLLQRISAAMRKTIEDPFESETDDLVSEYQLEEAGYDDDEGEPPPS